MQRRSSTAGHSDLQPGVKARKGLGLQSGQKNAMATRTTERTVTFGRPFNLSAVDGPLASGSYFVITEEEVLEGLSFAPTEALHERLASTAHPVSTFPGSVDRGLRNAAHTDLTAARVRRGFAMNVPERICQPSGQQGRRFPHRAGLRRAAAGADGPQDLKASAFDRWTAATAASPAVRRDVAAAIVCRETYRH